MVAVNNYRTISVSSRLKFQYVFKFVVPGKPLGLLQNHRFAFLYQGALNGIEPMNAVVRNVSAIL